MREPSGDQQGEDLIVSAMGPPREAVARASLTQISGLPLPVRTIATCRPSGLKRALMFVPL